jgi:hypothetical protein
LLGRFKVLIVRIRIVELTLFGGVLPANIGARFVDAASIVFLQMFTNGVHQQVPGFAFSEQRSPIVQQVPSQVVKIRRGSRCVNRKSKIATALCRAVVAKIFVRTNVFAAKTDFWFVHMGIEKKATTLPKEAF